jgi:hypothetical protein
MRNHPLLRVSLLLSAVLITSRGIAPPDVWAHTAHAPKKAVWDSADVNGDGVIDR